MDAATLTQKLEEARRGLLDLSTRNRLLALPKPGRSRGVVIFHDEDADFVVSALLDGKAFGFEPAPEAEAPPAPTRSTSAPASRTPALPSRSATSPRPSVLSPKMRSPSNRSVLQAPASRARSLRSSARAAASNLKGRVTLQPRPPSARNRRTVSANASSGASSLP